MLRPCDQKASAQTPYRGLMVKSPWIEKILSGEKTWEIRGTETKRRGRIGLMQSGTGKIQGTAELVNVIGPLTLDEYNRNADKHRDTPQDKLPYAKTYAWVMKNPVKLAEPAPYTHPSGAVTWVGLPETTGQKLNLSA